MRSSAWPRSAAAIVNGRACSTPRGHGRAAFPRARGGCTRRVHRARSPRLDPPAGQQRPVAADEAARRLDAARPRPAPPRRARPFRPRRRTRPSSAALEAPGELAQLGNPSSGVPGQASSAVSRVRPKAEWPTRSTGPASAPSARAWSRPDSVKTTCTEGSPFSRSATLNSDSACRASTSSLKAARSGSRGRGHPDAVVEPDRRHVVGADEGRRSAHARAAGGSGRAGPGFRSPCRAPPDRSTCCSCTARGVQADASALKRMTPPSSQSHERPSSICASASESRRVAPERVDPELTLVGERACGHEALEIGELGRPQPAPPARGLGDRVDGLARPVLAGRGELLLRRLPELGHRTLLADQHPGPSLDGDGCERAAAVPGRNDVRAGVTERDEASALLDPAEAAEPAAGDVLEEDSLHRIPGAVLENLLQRRLDDVRHPLECRV